MPALSFGHTAMDDDDKHERTAMDIEHQIVSDDQWTQERLRLLAREKEFTRLRDKLSRQRRELPWEPVEKQYEFTGSAGKLSLGNLFGACSQLIVFHFMLGPDWEEGCKSCSFWADNFDGTDVHLNHRDVTFAAVSQAPLAKIEAYAKRMGWSFPWYSSFGSDFNFDYQVSFSAEQITARAKRSTTMRSVRTRCRNCRASACSRWVRTGQSITPILLRPRA